MDSLLFLHNTSVPHRRKASLSFLANKFADYFGFLKLSTGICCNLEGEDCSDGSQLPIEESIRLSKWK